MLLYPSFIQAVKVVTVYIKAFKKNEVNFCILVTSRIFTPPKMYAIKIINIHGTFILGKYSKSGATRTLLEMSKFILSCDTYL
jgi:hypothetical protein